MSSTSTNFYASELQTALDDQSFGIQLFCLTSSTPYEARASVKLLEGNAITVKLTIQGYTIEPSTSSEGLSKDTFDSIENLLCSISHLYKEKRHDAWANKLEELLGTKKIPKSLHAEPLAPAL
ncbi:hypothetical protein E4T56_gene18380 [Termitomyces sp. T112]|nr:hypothetical protein E4T56_gene18380 [Termitomyces sp. T112]KAH0586271.1 hypothetical protein H2248_007519 [Termitomyces sp. 'cryptogamus']